MMRRTAAVLALTVLLMAGASAQQQSPPPSQPTPAEIAAETASMQGYGDAEKTCIAWTDSCMNCTRAANGDPLCSNIGFACQPKAISCTTRTEPAKKQ